MQSLVHSLSQFRTVASQNSQSRSCPGIPAKESKKISCPTKRSRGQTPSSVSEQIYQGVKRAATRSRPYNQETLTPPAKSTFTQIMKDLSWSSERQEISTSLCLCQWRPFVLNNGGVRAPFVQRRTRREKTHGASYGVVHSIG